MSGPYYSCRLCGRGEQVEIWCAQCIGENAALWDAIQNPPDDGLTEEQRWRRDHATERMLRNSKAEVIIGSVSGGGLGGNNG